VFQPGNEYQAQAFHNHMEFKTLSKKLHETVPVEEILGNSTNEDIVLLVDVGGNTGLDTVRFHQAWSKLPGKRIVQDLPATIDTLDRDQLKPIEVMGHNFFTEQPVKGAGAYYLKMVLHDWPDKQAKEILSNLEAAL